MTLTLTLLLVQAVTAAPSSPAPKPVSAPLPAQFNLACTGTQAIRLTQDAIKDVKPWSARLAIDLDQLLISWNGQLPAQNLVQVTPSQIVLSQHSTPDDQERTKIDRITGRFSTVSDTSYGWQMTRDAVCEPQPFSGLAKQKF